jgi:hypothetical protein
MFFTVTIDTEEDDWGVYTSPSYGVKNFGRVPRVHDLLLRRNVKPTYLITYPIATDPAAAAQLARWQCAGECEVGTHPHPWNTPPVREELTRRNSFISNLDAELQFQKICTLTETIANNIGRRPTSYRSGRWGFNEDVARNLIRLDYAVDSSIYPMSSWRDLEGPDFSSLPHHPFEYRMDGDPTGKSLLEVPASVDFLQSPRGLSSAVFHGFRRVPGGHFVTGALAKLGVLNHVAISPELHLVPPMIRLTHSMLSRGTRIINLFFHSPTLLPGCSPFVRTEADAEAFLARIDQFLEFVQTVGLKPVMLSELTAPSVGAADTVVLRR